VSTPRILVVAAVIERERLILIGQRRADDRHPLKWEFPGGKVESHESPREALKRELEEELGIQADIGPEIARYQFRYPKRSAILLIFHSVTQYSGQLAGRCFEQIRWEERGNLPNYDFLDGDLDFVRRLARGEV
jgi:8-oxo-dGTP diphosphatase